MNTYHVYTAHINPALNGSSVLERFECSNVIEICNRIMFDFYLGLPHLFFQCVTWLHLGGVLLVSNMSTFA